MADEKGLPKRKPTRYKDFDYSRDGVYFITVCTEKRQPILSRIVGSASTQSHPTVGADVLDGPRSVLTPYGRIVDKYIRQLHDFYGDISVERYVIMPNHIHLLLWVKSEALGRSGLRAVREVGPYEREAFAGAARSCGPSGRSAPTRQHAAVSRFVSTLKRFCNKEFEKNVFQRSFYDHVIRNQKDYEEHEKYILENPARWFYDKLFVEE